MPPLLFLRLGMQLGVCASTSHFWPKWRWIVEAAHRIGWHAQWLRDENQLRALEDTCDFVLFDQRPPVAPGALLEIGSRRRSLWVCWCFDLFQSPVGRMLLDVQAWSVFDLILAKDTNPLRERHHRVEYLDQGAPRFNALSSDLQWDVLVPGQPYARRLEIVRAMREAGLSVAATNRLPWNSSDLVEAEAEYDYPPKLFCRAKMVLCENYRNDIAGYWSDRMWIAMACGVPCLCARVPGLENIVTDRANVLLYDCVDEAVEKALELSSKDQERDRIGKAGWRLANANLYEHRLEALRCAVLDA